LRNSNLLSTRHTIENSIESSQIYHGPKTFFNGQ